MLSYLSRWASVALSVRSFTPTSSMSAPEASTARKKLRPMRPKPLMPTRMVTGSISSPFWSAGRRLRPAAAGSAPTVLGAAPSTSTCPADLRRASEAATARVGAARRGRPVVPAPSPYRSDPIRARATAAAPGRAAGALARQRPISTASISGVTAASVSGMPRSRARLSARASSRRIRPAIASLVSGGSASAPSSSSDACRCSSRSRPALVRWFGRLVGEDLQRPGDPGGGGHRRARRAAQVGVVEVGQPVGGGPHLAAYPALLPGQHAGVRADPGEQRGDRVAVLDHHPVDAADLALLGGDADPAGRADAAPAPTPARGR